MEIVDRRTAFRAPDAVFGHPQRVVTSTALSHDEKVALLRKWKSTLEKLRRPNATPNATSTSHPAAGPVDAEKLAASGKLAAIKDALMELRRQ